MGYHPSCDADLVRSLYAAHLSQAGGWIPVRVKKGENILGSAMRLLRRFPPLGKEVNDGLFSTDY